MIDLIDMVKHAELQEENRSIFRAVFSNPGFIDPG
jgi:hypothetical protein